MLKRLLNLPKSHSFFLLGARGTGKTTLIEDKFLGPESLHIDLLDTDNYTRLSLRPSELKARITPGIQRVILDEVQKIPSLLDEVHSLMEKNKSLQFVLTGSSARKLKRGGANLLAGRAFVFNLHPFTHRELGSSFELQQALNWGTLPKIFELADDFEKKEYLKAYAKTYLQEEILQEQLIRKLEPFQRFLPIAAQMSGKILNYRTIAADVGVAPQTVENYFHILSDTLLGFFLPSYHPSIRKQEREAPRFYLFDLGVKKALSMLLDVPVETGTSMYGDYFEEFVIQEAVRLNSYTRKDYRFSYYRTKSGVEVDLVVERGGLPTLLIEIKSTDFLQERAVSKLNVLVEDFENTQAYCFSRDPNAKQFGKVKCLHWVDGMREIGLE